VASSAKRTRGPNKQKPWSRNPDDGLAVLRLPLDTSDASHRRKLEAMFQGAYTLRRAVQRDARDRCRAYWAATHERDRDVASVRARLGLSKKGLEQAARAHLDAAPHLRRNVTKALAQHIADDVWAPVQRHLFRDASGTRQGLLKITRWFDFTRLPGRARSHTKERVWETFSLRGTLAGHRAAYTDRTGDFVQPRHLRPVTSTAWWSYEGPLAIVFTGLADDTLVLPVRLPTAPSNQPVLDYYLSDPTQWHKIDVVRRQDAAAPGGWRYEAHLSVLTQPYVSPSAAARRARAALATVDRSAGIDVNVSNLSIASHDTGRNVQLTRIERDEPRKASDRKRKKRERRRQRELERSRRAANRAQYQLSKRQEKRARRREAAGRRPVEVIPMGPRKARVDGVPLQSFRKDDVSASYRRTRRAMAADANAAARARRDQARKVAADVVAMHGTQLVVEDTSIAAWAKTWGRALSAFSPGMLVDAIGREARAVAAMAGGSGGVQRASTRTTALSQHCPCGARVDKRLADRVHRCDACGLCGDRDAVAAVLASFTLLVEGDNPSSARVDYAASADALGEIRRAVRFQYDGWQDTRSESTDLSARDGSFVAWRTSTPDSVAVARRNVGYASCSTLNETGQRRTTSERARRQTNMSRRYGPPWTYLRDNS
jgi:hypothetical protein